MYVKGAKDTLEQVQALEAPAVVLKEYSPFWGSQMIYQGDFSGKTKPGDGGRHEEVGSIDQLNEDEPTGPDPDNFDF
ncbi:hypothetical protein BACPU_13770 [Bacillus pumilus]|nr:hypothetical protein BACPU_13770 [Bacillus pumilus]